MTSSILLNDDLIVDFASDLVASTGRLGISLTGAKYWLQTHPHTDHMGQMTIYALTTSMLANAGIGVLQLYCSPATVDRLDDMYFRLDPYKRSLHKKDMQPQMHLEIHEIGSDTQFEVGPYRVETADAGHDPGIDAMVYAIEDTRSGAQVFYGTDSGGVPPRSWERLAQHGWVFDALILDHSYGPVRRAPSHHGQESFVAEVEAARTAGAIDDKTQILATHVSHFSYPTYAAMLEAAKQHGYVIAHDGLTIKLSRSGARHVLHQD